MFLPFLSLSTSATQLPGLLLLETVLSADNALALASLVRPVEIEAERQSLLNWGMATAVVLRLLAVGAAGIVLHQPLVRILGGGYLMWLSSQHFRSQLRSTDPLPIEGLPSEAPAASRTQTRLSLVFLLAGTNLAFSLDSICAALALTDNLPLVMVAGTMGILALRWFTTWLVRWMEAFPNLSNAGYLIVLAVGLRMVAEQVIPPFSPPDPLMMAMILIILTWGFLHPQSAKL